MKKIGLAFLALVLVFIIYYMTTGSQQIKGEMKQEIKKELVALKSYGFEVKEQNLSKDKQHIVLSFKDTDKIFNYLKEKNLNEITKADIEIFKGMEIAMDIEYMPSVKYAVSMDIYPLRLPDIFYQDITTPKERKILEELDKMIKDKVFLVHININKLLNAFDGYLKDIDRKITQDGESLHLLTKGFKFNGTIKDENKIDDITETLNVFAIKLENQLDINLSDSKYSVNNFYDTYNQTIDYSIKSFNFVNKPALAINLQDMAGISKEELKGKLIDASHHLKIALANLDDKGDKIQFKNISIASKTKNINKDVLEKLQDILARDDKNSMNEIFPLMKELIKNDIAVEISDISIEKIIKDGKEFDGFKIKGIFDTEKNVDLQSINNPESLLNILHAKIEIEASNEFVNYLSKNPQMVIMMMLIQPVDKNGKKYYDIEFTKGTLKINGKPFM